MCQVCRHLVPEEGVPAVSKGGRGFNTVCVLAHHTLPDYKIEKKLYTREETKKHSLPLGLMLLSASTGYFVHPKDFSSSHHSHCAHCATGCHKMCCMRITVKIATAPGGSSASPTAAGRNEVQPHHPHTDGHFGIGQGSRDMCKSHPLSAV